MTSDVDRQGARASRSCARQRGLAGRFAWFAAAALGAAFAAACSSTGGRDQPDWVDGSAAQYPAGQYLLGRGSAESVDLAQERARADLAKVFEVAIAVDGSDIQRAKGQDGAMRYEAASEQRIVTRTDQVISGLRIAELWSEPVPAASGKGRQHALAVLPRLQAGVALRQEIAARDEAIERQVLRARAATDALQRAGLAARALVLARERAGFDKSLRVVDPGGRGVDTTLGVARLQADLDEQLKRLALIPALSASGPFDAASLLPLVQGAIASAGFLASDDAGAATAYAVKVNARLTEEYLEGWHWVRGNVELSVVDAAGRVRGSKAWPVKASAQEQSAARARTLLEIERLLKDELRSAVLGFIAA